MIKKISKPIMGVTELIVIIDDLVEKVNELVEEQNKNKFIQIDQSL
jgi:hypothetical protein